MKPVILFVDDDQRVLNSLKSIFKKKYTCIFANSGQRALELINTYDFNVIVSDERMPVLRGHQLLATFKQISPSTVRILLTGFADLDATMSCINDAEIFRYINKPWNHDELIAALDDAVQSSISSNIRYIYQNQKQQNLQSDIASNHRTVDLLEQATRLRNLSRTIIILDRNVSLAAAISANFKDEYEIHHAKNLIQLTELTKHLSDLAILIVDVDLTGSLEIIHQMNLMDPTVVIIAISQHLDNQVAQSLINFGHVFRYLCKPLGHIKTEQVIDEAIKEHEALRENKALRISTSGKTEDMLSTKPEMNKFYEKIKQLKSKLLE